jgi:hypothetical protein
MSKGFSIFLIATSLVSCTKKTPPAVPPAPKFSHTYSVEEDAPEILDDERLSNPLPSSGGCFESECVAGNSELVYKADGIYEVKVDSRVVGSLDLAEKDFPEVDSVHLHAFRDTLLVTYQIGKENLGASRVLALNKADLKQKWKLNVQGFNLGHPLLEGKYLYVGSIGFVGKVDVEKGKYVWDKRDLFKKYKFDGPETISIHDGVVEFAGKDVTIRVNDKTGKVL